MFRVYVGNLPYRVREAELKEFFAACGNVVDAVVPLTEDRRSKGFGFVELGDEDSFRKALAMDGQQMDGRPLRISEARPREDRRETPAAPAAPAMQNDDQDMDADDDSAAETDEPAEGMSEDDSDEADTE